MKGRCLVYGNWMEEAVLNEGKKMFGIWKLHGKEAVLNV